MYLSLTGINCFSTQHHRNSHLVLLYWKLHKLDNIKAPVSLDDMPCEPALSYVVRPVINVSTMADVSQSDDALQRSD